MELILALAPVLLFLYSAYEANTVENTGKTHKPSTLPKGWKIVDPSEKTRENEALDSLDFLTEPKIDLDKLRSRLQYKYTRTL